MNYSLGNMLSRGGALNPDGLSLDLQFATDKTLTARKGPTPAFTRATGATQVNAAGLIEYAPENLILYSNNVANASWSIGGGTIASSAETVNGLTAEIYNEDSTNSIHRFFRVNTGLAGITSTFSVWLKAAGRRYVCVNLGSSGPNANSKLVLDLVDRVVIAGTAGVTTNILLENNGWARYSFTFIPRVDSGTMPIQSNFSSTVVSETGVGLNGAAFYVAGQQYERFSSARPYLLTTANPAHTPRFDHDPVTFACKGLLIEESRTNLATYSEDFSLGFAIERASIDPNITTAPNGSTTADKLIEDTTPSNNHRLTRIVNLSAIPYTFSVFAKASERSWIRLTLFDNVTARQVWFNVSAGVIGTQSGAIGQIQSFGNGWWRCSITATGLAFISSQANIALATADNISAYTGDGTSGLFLWGAQLEAGSFPTSYIPTAAAAVPCSADVCSITGSDFTGFYNQSEGTAVTKVTNASGIGSLTQYPFSFSGSSATELLIVYRSGSAAITPRACRFGSVVLNNDTLLDSPDAGVFADNAISIAGFAIKLNNFAGSFNGNLITDTTVSLPAVDRMFIGNRVDGTRTWNGHIAYIRYYKKRLPDAKLQSLTL